MKRFLTFLFLWSVTAVLATCKKQKDCEILYTSGGGIGVTTPKNELFQVNLKIFHYDTTDVSIESQSKHFAVSELKKVNTEFIYRYKPSLDYTGFDSVFFQTRNCRTKTITRTSIMISVIN